MNHDLKHSLFEERLSDERLNEEHTQSLDVDILAPSQNLTESDTVLAPPHPEDEKDRHDREAILEAIDRALATESDPDELERFAYDLHDADLFPSARDALAKKAATIRASRAAHQESEQLQIPDTLKG